MGVLLLNENKLDEMTEILAKYMKWVPTKPSQGVVTLPNGEVILVDNTSFYQILFGGDQLTVARMRGAQALRDTHDDLEDKFEGLAPVIEDWHARMTLMKVSSPCYFEIGAIIGTNCCEQDFVCARKKKIQKVVHF